MIDENKLAKEISELMIYRAELHSPRYFALQEVLELIKKQPKIGEWIPFTIDSDGDFNCQLPKEEEEVFISNGRCVWVDTFMYDGEEYYFDNYNCNLIGCAWQPILEPWEGK